MESSSNSLLLPIAEGQSSRNITCTYMPSHQCFLYVLLSLPLALSYRIRCQLVALAIHTAQLYIPQAAPC
jgi:hypothetical protein